MLTIYVVWCFKLVPGI